MKRNSRFLMFGIFAASLLTASWGSAQEIPAAADPQRPDFPSAQDAGASDPQRPDGGAAEDPEAPKESPAEVPAAPAIPDPQRPDEHRPQPSHANPNETSVIYLTLTPAAEPVPALKYELLPGPPERTPGNGATNYYRAFMHAQQVADVINKDAKARAAFQEYDNWLQKPLKEMPKEDMEKWVGYYRNTLAEVKAAAYREQCQFELREQDLRGLDTIGFLLHDFQFARDLGRALRVRARLEVAGGKLDEALETVRQGLQLSRDTTEPDLLINGLIGIAIASQMQDELLEIIDQPASPNLYWALASLPRPLVDIHRGMRFEMDMPERMLPFLKDAETNQRTPEEWQKLVVECLGKVSEIAALAGPTEKSPEWQSRITAVAGLLLLYPDAKKRLMEDGMSREELEKMPVAQVVAIQAARAQKRIYHEVFKWSALPYSQQGTRAEDSTKKLVAEMGGPGQITAADPLFLGRLLLPAVHSAMAAEVRLQSKFAAIQTIEALRMHAAAHDGQLPKSLEDVTIVPVPLNPATDKPFPYELKAGVATLTVLPPAGRPAGDGRKYIIQMENK
jgi:hypothetical protein